MNGRRQWHRPFAAGIRIDKHFNEETKLWAVIKRIPEMEEKNISKITQGPNLKPLNGRVSFYDSSRLEIFHSNWAKPKCLLEFLC